MPVATVGQCPTAPTEAGAETELSVCSFQFLSKPVFQFAKPRLKDFKKRLYFRQFKVGNRNPPLKANLSALSFRRHKKGRARRGMSDKVKTIYNLIGVLNCDPRQMGRNIFYRH